MFFVKGENLDQRKSGKRRRDKESGIMVTRLLATTHNMRLAVAAAFQTGFIIWCVV